MSKRIKVADLPAFDAAPYLYSETAIAAYTAAGALDTTYVDGGKEVFASGLATNGFTPSVGHIGLPRPNADSGGSIECTCPSGEDHCRRPDCFGRRRSSRSGEFSRTAAR